MISFEDLMEIYRLKLVASYEKSLGQEVLGNEIAAYTYWQHTDKKAVGYMNISDFVEFSKV
jgi:leucine-zipper-like transcriptional regulator 1